MELSVESAVDVAIQPSLSPSHPVDNSIYIHGDFQIYKIMFGLWTPCIELVN